MGKRSRNTGNREERNLTALLPGARKISRSGYEQDSSFTLILAITSTTSLGPIEAPSRHPGHRELLREGVEDDTAFGHAFLLDEGGASARVLVPRESG